MSNKAQMLDQIKNHYGFTTDIEFAVHLGIKPQVLSNWKSRNTFDAELIYDKCKALNPAWLLCQEGTMLREDDGVQRHVNEEKPIYLLRKEIKVLEEQLKSLKKTHTALEKSESFFLKAIQLVEEQLKGKKESLQKK